MWSYGERTTVMFDGVCLMDIGEELGKHVFSMEGVGRKRSLYLQHVSYSVIFRQGAILFFQQC